MSKRSQTRQNEKRHDRERELTGHYRKIRIRALAGALEHQGENDNNVRKRKRSASYTRNKPQAVDVMSAPQCRVRE